MVLQKLSILFKKFSPKCFRKRNTYLSVFISNVLFKWLLVISHNEFHRFCIFCWRHIAVFVFLCLIVFWLHYSSLFTKKTLRWRHTRRALYCFPSSLRICKPCRRIQWREHYPPAVFTLSGTVGICSPFSPTCEGGWYLVSEFKKKVSNAPPDVNVKIKNYQTTTTI